MPAPSFKELPGFLACESLRMAERVLPVPILQLLVWPAAAARSAWELAYAKPTIGEYYRLPAALHPPLGRAAWLGRIWWRRAWMNSTKLLRFWPDRLQEPRWQRRCECDGIEAFERMCSGTQPVVLVVLHTGPLGVLYHWLRARGLAAAALVARDLRQRPFHQRRLDRLSDRASGLAGVPRFFEVGQLWDVREFLQPGKVLIIGIDGGEGRQLLARAEDCCMPIAPGCLQLAALADAIVVPCLIRATSGLGFALHFGAPVPAADVADRRRHLAACEHIFGELLRWLRTETDQCSHELLRRFQSLAAVEGPVGGVEEVRSTGPRPAELA